MRWSTSSGRSGTEEREKGRRRVRTAAGLFLRDAGDGPPPGIGVDAAVLTRTMEDYNAAVRGETVGPFGRERFFHEPSAPCCVMKVSNGVACTTGGLKVDEQMRVIDTEGNPIGNLYAIGEISGGYRIHYVGGDSLSHSGISGMLIGRQLTQ